jgi:hypothetical protein
MDAPVQPIELGRDHRIFQSGFDPNDSPKACPSGSPGWCRP